MAFGIKLKKERMPMKDVLVGNLAILVFLGIFSWFGYQQCLLPVLLNHRSATTNARIEESNYARKSMSCQYRYFYLVGKTLYHRRATGMVGGSCMSIDDWTIVSYDPSDPGKACLRMPGSESCHVNYLVFFFWCLFGVVQALYFWGLVYQIRLRSRGKGNPIS